MLNKKFEKVQTSKFFLIAEILSEKSNLAWLFKKALNVHLEIIMIITG